MLAHENIENDYQFCYLLDDVREAEKILRNTKVKTQIYLDDFLGGNTAEMINAKGNERSLLVIISRIKRSENTRLIFTTRTEILNSVLEDSEKQN